MRPTDTPTDTLRRVVLAGACALAVLGLAACSGDDGPAGSADADDAAADTDSGSGDDRSTTSEPSSSTTAEGGPTTTAVPGVPGEAAEPQPLDATADAGGGIEVRLSRIEAVEAEATLPGEVGGPAVAVTVEVANGSDDAVELGSVTVDLVTGDGASAPPVLDPDREPLAGDLDAGDTRSGTYVFTLAPDQRGDVSVRVRPSADTPTLVFTGAVPDA